MPAPIFRRADFRAALQALLPTGRVWPREADTAQAKVLDGLSGVYERQSTDATSLLAEAFPATTSALLTEWEDSLGLPDECTGPAETLDARRLRIVQKLTAAGGQSRPYFLGLAKGLGFPDAFIEEFLPFTAISPCAAPLTQDWQSVWRLTTNTDAGVLDFTVNSSCSDPIKAWGSAVLECIIRRAAPAHTSVLFAYVDSWDWMIVGTDENWGLVGDPELDAEDWGALS